MVNPEDVPLILLYTDGRSAIDGTTRFQKLVFLAQKEQNLGKLFEFEPYKYGPYSADLQAVIQSHERSGLIERSEEITALGNERHTYSITTEGIQEVQALLADNNAEEVFEALQEIKQEFNSWGGRRLLRYVYNRYENYATESELAEGDLEDPQAELAVKQQSSPEATVGDVEEPSWKTADPSVEPGEQLPEKVEYYVNLIREVSQITDVYYEERDEDPDCIVAVLEERDFDVMDRIYDIELELRDNFPNEALTFRVTVQEAIEPVVGQGARRVYSRE